MVNWFKPKEHLFRISTLEMCLGGTMNSRDADPKLLCSPGFPPHDGVGSTLK